jgi:hypothetical protein
MWFVSPAAANLVTLPERSSPRKSKVAKVEGGSGKLFRGKALLDKAAEDSPMAAREDSAVDAVTVEVERWKHLSQEIYSEFVSEDDDLLNEFEMMWALRDRFPLHFILFKQTACHLAHEANVEQVFSRAGNLADPNMDPEFLAHLVMCAVNKKAFMPSLKAIKDKYYELFRGKGGSGDDADEGNKGEAGPSSDNAYMS